MDPKHLPPAVLLALGLTVTADGCCPWIPEVSDTPCLSVPLNVCLSPPVDTGVGPCLEPMPVDPPPADEPPADEPPADEPPPDEPPLGPCLKPLPPPEHQVCLSPPLPPKPAPAGDQGQLDEPQPGTRRAALLKVIGSGVLPPDVADRVRKG